MEKMSVITFSRTGHLLGVVTRASQSQAAVTVAQVAADGFRLRGSYSGAAADNSTVVLDIPEDEISVTLVDYDTRVLYRPHLFALSEGKPEQKEEGAISIGLDGTRITATLPINVSDSTAVWCQISGGSLTEPIVRSVTIPGTSDNPTKTGTEALSLSAGEYRVAMFAPGYALAVFKATVP